MKFETERLIIRDWQSADRDAYASFVADPDVRRFYPNVLDKAQANEMIDRFIEFYKRDGYGFLPVIRKSDNAIIGDVGIIPVGMPLRGEPPVEIGWLLGKQYWGNGYAVEAAQAWLDHAFNALGMNEVVAWTCVTNLPSQRVMQKLGMTTDPIDDFLHPKIAEGHPLRPHVLYRIARPNSA